MSKHYYQNNKERILESQKIYYLKNKEWLNQKRKEWRQKNRERLLQEKKEYYQKNKESFINRRKLWYQKNKHTYWNEKGKYRAAKSKATRKKHSFDLSIEEFRDLLKGNVCHYCDKPLNKWGSGLDRKDSSIGYTKENCVACCKRCNITFNNLYTYKEKIMLAKTIVNIDRLREEI